MSSATPSDTDPTADASEDPTIGRRREVFEEHKDAFKHQLPLVYTPFDTRVKDVIKLLVEKQVVANRPSVPQTRIAHHLSSISSLEDLLEDPEYHGKNHAALCFLKIVMESLNCDFAAQSWMDLTNITEKEKKNKGLCHRMWFLASLSATQEQLQYSLEQYRTRHEYRMSLVTLAFTPGHINGSNASTDGQDSVPSMPTQRVQRNITFDSQRVSIQNTPTVIPTPYTGPTQASAATAPRSNFPQTPYPSYVPQTEVDQRNTITIPEHPAHTPAPVPNVVSRAHARTNAQDQVQFATPPRRSPRGTQDARYDNSEQSQMNKSKNVEAYFKDKKFSGKSHQSIIITIEDYEICADQQVLSEDQMAMCFVNVFEGAAREYFMLHTNKDMTFREMADAMVNHYHSASAQLKLQAEADGMSLTVYMKRNDIADLREGLKGYIEYINRTVPRLPEGFNRPVHKKRRLRLGTMMMPWAKAAIQRTEDTSHDFDSLADALLMDLQLHDDVKQMHEFQTNYGQYQKHPSDVRKRDSDPYRSERRNRSDHQYRQNRGDYRPSRWDNNRYQARSRSLSRDPRYRSRSTSRDRYRNRSRSLSRDRDRPRYNPSLRGRFCIGCGSKDHKLSDNVCNVSLREISSHIAELDSHIKKAQRTHFAKKAEPERNRASNTYPKNVNFVEDTDAESMTDNSTDEQDILTRYVEKGFQRMPPLSSTRKEKSRQSNKNKSVNCKHISISTLHTRSIEPQMFCVDIGAPRSCIGRKQLRRILHMHGKRTISRHHSDRIFRFGDVSVKSLGTVEIHLATPEKVPDIPVILDVVNVDIPALLGLDVLDGYSLMPDNVTNRLWHRVVLSKQPLEVYDEWSIPLHRTDSHLYAEMAFAAHTFYTMSQLRKFHRQFCHPSAGKLYNLLKKAGQEAVTADTLKQLEHITKTCDPCQRIRSAPHRFRVTLGAENTRFNQRVYIDIMFIEGKPVLHLVDDATRFSAARFMTHTTSKAIWEAILECWITVYTGLPHTIMTDMGTQFRDSFAEIAALHDIDMDTSGTEAHNSIGVGERYHTPLRNTFRKLRIDHPSVDKKLLLQMAVKACNDTLGPEGIVPSALVFGTYPSIRSFLGPKLPKETLAERAELAQTARKQMAKEMAKVKLARARKHKTPASADRSYAPGDKVLVWREKIVNNRIGEFIGPLTVISYDEFSKIVLVKDETSDSAPQRFSTAQVVPYNEEEPEGLATSFMRNFNETFAQFKTIDNVEGIHLTEIIHPGDPRSQDQRMRQAITEEVQDLLRRGTFKVILKEELPDGANALTARFVLAIKSKADGKIKFKARYVIGGHRDILKRYLVHGAQTLQAASARLILSLASICDFDVWSTDVKLAYLQSSEPLKRKVYIKNPAPEFELEPQECFELLKPLYGLSDAGDHWHRTLDAHLKDDLGMAQTKPDPALYFKHHDDHLIGINGSYVDDLLRAGDGIFRDQAAITHDRFETSGDETLPFEFAGFTITRTHDQAYAIDQTEYLKKLEEIDDSSTFSKFMSTRMKLAWLANTRPDLQVDISQIAQITQQQYEENPKPHIKRVNTTIRYAKTNITQLKFPKLRRDSLRIVGYSDAAFANNTDLSSQLGRIILLMDETGACSPISFKSYKSRRVTRSVLSAEVVAFADLFDDSFAIRDQIEQALGQPVPMHLLTDSKSLFDIISKGSRTSEKRIMLDIYAARQAYNSKEISNIGFVRSSYNLADGLTKPNMQASLLSLLKSATHKIEAEQWIVRDA